MILAPLHVAREGSTSSHSCMLVSLWIGFGIKSLAGT